jgi:hypothetical protein
MLGSRDSLGVPDGLPLDEDALDELLGEAGADGVGEGAEAGAVGVGTGGLPHRHSRFVGFTVRTGPGTVAGGTAATGVAAAPGAGTVSTGACRRGGRVDGPSPVSAVTVGATAGSVPAAAGCSSRIGTSPFITTRYAPAAPSTVSSPNAETRAARRAGRGRTAGAGSYPHAVPPNVFIPVEVTSGPETDGSAGCRPMS